MSRYIKEEFINENDYTFLYQCFSVAEFKQKIDTIMQQQGYRRKSEHIYEKGNPVLRMLLGAFYKHYKMQIKLEPLADNQARVALKKCSSGLAGGVIGMNQIQKELRSLKALFQAL